MVAFPNQLYHCGSKSSVILINGQDEKTKLLFKKQHFILVVDSNIFKNV
jgi:hypothetical protein